MLVELKLDRAYTFAYALKDAKAWLEKAVASASLPGSHSTDKQLAQAKLQLGTVYWQLGLSSQVTLLAGIPFDTKHCACLHFL